MPQLDFGAGPARGAWLGVAQTSASVAGQSALPYHMLYILDSKPPFALAAFSIEFCVAITEDRNDYFNAIPFTSQPCEHKQRVLSLSFKTRRRGAVGLQFMMAYGERTVVVGFP